MNRILLEEIPGQTHLRDQLFEMISDQDLAYRLPGDNITLGELCEEMGRHQQAYTRSFVTRRMDWADCSMLPDMPPTVAGLRSWFEKLDAELADTLSIFTDAELDALFIERGTGFSLPAFVQFQIYHEALLIFYAKASIYLKALEKPLTDEWKVGIG